MSGYNNTGRDDDKMNKHFSSILANNKKTATDSSGEDVQNIAHDKPPSGGGDSKNDGMMSWNKLLESMDAIMEGIQNNSGNIEDASFIAPGDEGGGSVNNEQLISQLNQIFTPIMVMQSFEGDMTEQIKEAFSEASVLLEKNIIQFDDATKMAQLIATCALLIAREKNTPKYQMYAKGATIRKQMKLEIQEDEYEEAKALAVEYLRKVAATNGSSIARDAAKDLLLNPTLA